MLQLLKCLESHYTASGVEFDSDTLVDQRRFLEQCSQPSDTAPAPIVMPGRSRLSKSSPGRRALKREWGGVREATAGCANASTHGENNTPERAHWTSSQNIPTKPGPTSWNSPPTSSFRHSPPKRYKTARPSDIKLTDIKTEGKATSGQQESQKKRVDRSLNDMGSCTSVASRPYYSVSAQAWPCDSARGHHSTDPAPRGPVAGPAHPVSTPMTRPDTSRSRRESTASSKRKMEGE